jgi:hypothetical protein
MSPALEILSLGAISLENAARGVAYALNFSGLSSLTLRHCPGSEEFLTAVIDSRQTIRLSSLEVACGLSDDVDMCGTLSTFLKTYFTFFQRSRSCLAMQMNGCGLRQIMCSARHACRVWMLQARCQRIAHIWPMTNQVSILELELVK